MLDYLDDKEFKKLVAEGSDKAPVICFIFFKDGEHSAQVAEVATTAQSLFPTAQLVAIDPIEHAGQLKRLQKMVENGGPNGQLPVPSVVVIAWGKARVWFADFANRTDQARQHLAANEDAIVRIYRYPTYQGFKRNLRVAAWTTPFVAAFAFFLSLQDQSVSRAPVENKAMGASVDRAPTEAADTRNCAARAFEAGTQMCVGMWFAYADNPEAERLTAEAGEGLKGTNACRGPEYVRAAAMAQREMVQDVEASRLAINDADDLYAGCADALRRAARGLGLE